MKRKLLIIIFSMMLITVLILILYDKFNFKLKETESQIKSEEEDINVNLAGVSHNGWLKTSGNKLQNEKGKDIQLQGISSHGIDWFYNVITKENLQELVDNWNINVFRIAVYTDSNGYGYVHFPDSASEKISNIVDIAVDLDIYVIIDWHILDDNNPQIHKNEALNFFDELSKKYSNTPNVIYEICNEPNGAKVTWSKDVKPYAEEVIPAIRKNAPKSLIIVGTPAWCTDLKTVADDPLAFDNIAYSCHFYSGTHGVALRDKITYCLERNLPIFISECGLTNATGNGKLYFEEFDEWLSFINSNNLSWIYWSFSNKKESSSILLSTYSSNDSIDEYLSEAGKFIKAKFEK